MVPSTGNHRMDARPRDELLASPGPGAYHSDTDTRPEVLGGHNPVLPAYSLTSVVERSRCGTASSAHDLSANGRPASLQRADRSLPGRARARCWGDGDRLPRPRPPPRP